MKTNIAFTIGTCEALVQLIESSIKRSDNVYLRDRVLALTYELKVRHEEIFKTLLNEEEQ